MITKIAHFTCPVVKQRVELEMIYSQVPGYGDIHTGYGPCSHQLECGVATGQAKGTQFDWSLCPYASQRLSRPEDTRIV